MKGTLKIILTFIILVVMTGCSHNSDACSNDSGDLSTVEEEICDIGKEYVASYIADNSVKVDISKFNDHFELKINGDKCLTMLINSDFYEMRDMDTPELKNEIPVSEQVLDMYEVSKEIVNIYVEKSTIIETRDKDKVKKALNNIRLKEGEFTDLEDGIVMVTKDNTIYVNKKTESYISETECIHELIHVVSNVTNKGSKFQKSSYRSSFLNEAITDIIATSIAEKSGYIRNVETVYEDLYPEAYFMIGKFDNMLKTYFYSDGYEKINDNLFDLYVLMMNNCSEGGMKYIEFIKNEYVKSE